MFFIDDMLLRSIGIVIPGLDLIWVFEQIRDIAHREMYDPEKIKNQMKENRLLYELGEITKEEYEKRNADLDHELKLAMRVREMNLETRVDILGGR